MANKILTPITLWNDFNDSLPVNEQIVEEWTEEKSVFRKVRFSGRAVGASRVNILRCSAGRRKGTQFRLC